MRLAGFELRRFTRAPLTAAALAVLAVIPLMYGALYLWAFWDPTGNLDRVPAALVNEDRAVTDPDGHPVHAGRDLAERLQERQAFDWDPTDAAEAERGLREGRYHLVFRIPADFSASLVTPPDPHADPTRGRLVVVNEDATNYLSGVLARTVFTEVRAAAAGSTATGYFDRMLIGFTDLKTQVGQAADGAGQLAGGARTGHRSADQIASGASGASGAADQLAAGLGQGATGAQQLYAGLVALDAGAAQLADGTAKAAAGGRALADTVDAATDRIEPALRDNAEAIARAATVVADGAETIAAHLDALPALAGDAADRATAARDRLDELARRHPELAGDPAFQAARTAADDAVRAAQAVRDRLADMPVAQLRAELLRTARLARQVAAAAPTLADRVAAARASVDTLADSLDQLATGARGLHDGTVQARDSAGDLAGGLFRLATGARQLDGGLRQLSAGTARLAGGLGTLQAGAEDLAGSLADGADGIPGYGKDAAARAAVLGDPVELDRSSRHHAATYGVGFAPYFLGLALWVGAVITYMVLRPLTRRHLVSGAPARRVALAGWLPGAAVGLVQATALFLVLRFGLGLHPEHPVATLAYLGLTAVAFSAIVQLLGAWLGPAGRLVALALLMLQLTSAGGTYPVETTPAPLRAVHPLLPMTYVVSGLRHLVSGGPAGTVVTGGFVLAGFAAGAFALTTLVARRGRRLTPAALHPDLAI